MLEAKVFLLEFGHSHSLIFEDVANRVAELRVKN
jgi:hypothetical protein